MTDTTDSSSFDHDWVSPPGDTISDLLEERKWTKAELARRLGVTQKHVNEMLKGRAPITHKIAQRLEHVFSTPAKFWLEREANYQVAKQRRQEGDELRKNHSKWLQQFPISWLVKNEWIVKRSHKGFQIAELLNFFEVGSVEAWEKQMSWQAAFRASPAFDKKRGSVAVWLYKGEKLGREIESKDYDASRLKKSLSFIRSLTLEPSPGIFVEKLRFECAKHGVAVVLLDYPPGCPLSGATKWLSARKALLLLSLRHKTNDHLWFSFFHEIGHILFHSKKKTFIESSKIEDELSTFRRNEGENKSSKKRDTEQTEEREADEFARDVLIPPPEAEYLAELGAQGRASKNEVLDFANRLGIAPGIVVGRMQKEKWLPYSHLNDLKVRYKWKTKD